MFVRGRPSRAEFARRSLVALALGASALFALLTQLGDNGIVALWRLRSDAANLDREVAVLRRHNDRMQAVLESLAEDPETLERIAREYGFRREGEEVLAVRPLRPDPAVPTRRDP
jgi:cell division protein FtsB